MKFLGRVAFLSPALILGLSMGFSGTTLGQEQAQTAANTDASGSLAELQKEVRELKQMVLQLQQETTASRGEITRLREELSAQYRGTTPLPEAQSAAEQSLPQATAPTVLEQRLDHLEESQDLLSGKVDEQYQTKVESASKYRVRLSGIVLFNLFGNQGSVDNQDVPTWAVSPDTRGIGSGAHDANSCNSPVAPGADSSSRPNASAHVVTTVSGWPVGSPRLSRSGRRCPNNARYPARRSPAATV